MKLSDKSLRLLDGFTNKKEVWLEVDLREVRHHSIKASTIRFNASDLKKLTKRLKEEEKGPPSYRGI